MGADRNLTDDDVRPEEVCRCKGIGLQMRSHSDGTAECNAVLIIILTSWIVGCSAGIVLLTIAVRDACQVRNPADGPREIFTLHP